VTPTRCPCLSGETYDDCCGRFHAGPAHAPTAEALMRSRYAAFAVGDVDYLRRTWHPRTRPADLDLDPAVRWTRLDVLAVRAGGPFDTEGTVEFRAHHRLDAVPGSQHEVSRFVREDGRWLYVDAVDR
jgi:SEC-C motif-containing protein